MLLITFSGTVNDEFLKIHNKTFPKNPPKKRLNPNQCPMVSTIFVRDERTNYCVVNRLWAYSHEIGLNGRFKMTDEYWLEAELSIIAKDILILRDNLIKKAKIPLEELVGLRSPVYAGGDNYYTALEELGFDYDSSLTIGYRDENLDIDRPATYPYTMGNIIKDTKEQTATFKCIGKCPKQEHEFIWQVPVHYSYLENGDKCKDLTYECKNASGLKAIEIADVFRKNFMRHDTTRIPYMLNIDIQSMQRYGDELTEGLNMFLDELAEEDDTWVITLNQAIEWMKNPSSYLNNGGISAWGCESRVLDGCKIPGMDEPEEKKNTTKVEKEKKSIKALFPDGQNLVIGQTVFLLVLFVAIQQYDHWKNKKK